MHEHEFFEKIYEIYEDVDKKEYNFVVQSHFIWSSVLWHVWISSVIINISVKCLELIKECESIC